MMMEPGLNHSDQVQVQIENCIFCDGYKMCLCLMNLSETSECTFIGKTLWRVGCHRFHNDESSTNELKRGTCLSYDYSIQIFRQIILPMHTLHPQHSRTLMIYHITVLSIHNMYLVEKHLKRS